MSARRKGGRLRKLPGHRSPKPRRRGGLVVAHSMEQATAPERVPSMRQYRHGPYIVTWSEGRFTLALVGHDFVKPLGLGKPPRGLRRRINQALEEGKDNG